MHIYYSNASFLLSLHRKRTLMDLKNLVFFLSLRNLSIIFRREFELTKHMALIVFKVYKIDAFEEKVMHMSQY